MQPEPQMLGNYTWYPDASRIPNSNVYRFMQKHGLSDVHELHRRSVTDREWFWSAVMEAIGWEWFSPYQKVLDLSRGIMWPEWFVGGKTNVAHNCLDRHLKEGRKDKLALVGEAEDGSAKTYTYAQLAREVDALARGLIKLGLSPGDRVGIFLPMVAEAVIACLAVAKIGAIFMPAFSGYGPEAVATRLSDCGAVAMITADGFHRRGKEVAMKEVADAACLMAETVKHVVVLQHTCSPVPFKEGRDIWWHDLAHYDDNPLPAQIMDAGDPFMILYTSGTTGRPKGTLHTHTGFGAKAAQDMYHCFDVKEEDLLFWLTDMGWMMGPWAFLGTLILGASVLVYEGAQDYPGPDRLWRVAEKHRVTILGLSPTSIRALMPQGEEPVKGCDLSSLRILGSTGEPWNPEAWWWFHSLVGQGRCPIINYSGGTEISGGILGCLPILPQKPCSFTGPIPGMEAEVVGEDGTPVTGTIGELVLKGPWVGMTKGFFNDPARYLETYWSRFPNMWVHGDLAYIDDDGLWYIRGRSDDTLKVAGKRVGPAEVEAVLASHPAVLEAAAVGLPHDIKGEVLVCFVVLRPDHQPSEDLRRELKKLVMEKMGKSLAPELVKFTREIPKTRNAKILRRLIRAQLTGTAAAADLSSLENPSALEAIAEAT